MAWWKFNSKRRPYVRPWALLAPICVLVVAVPLIHVQNPVDLSPAEKSRLATIQALSEQGIFAIDDTRPEFRDTPDRIEMPSDAAPIAVDGKKGPPKLAHFSAQPPTLSILLAGPAWALERLGLSFSRPRDTSQIIYYLTLIGAAIPAAFAAGMIYRMGRLFELPRPWRAGLGLATVLGSGLIAYATSINPHALAAALVLAACACFFHVGIADQPRRTGAWLMVAGFCAALAAAIDFPAASFLILLISVIFAMGWKPSLKVGGLVLYAFGALPPIVLHLVVTFNVTGGLQPAFASSFRTPGRPPAPLVTGGRAPAEGDDPEDEPGGEPSPLWAVIKQVVDATFGAHGLFSHFPIAIIGLAGVGVVLRRHWPYPTKALAVVSVLGATAIIAVCILLSADWNQPMFATRWFIVFLPLIVFWGGAWVRKRHHPIAWGVAAALLLFSIIVGLIGAISPFAPNPAGDYTVAVAARRLLHTASDEPPPRAGKPPVFAAGR